MQSAMMNPTALFQHYLENKFKVPREMKNDIIYCQRALKAHIKVHQMVLDVYKSQTNPDPIQKKRIIDELETQIYEINAEQHYLLLRLRRLIDEFYKALNRKGVPVLPEIMNDLVSNELVPHINDQSLLIYPTSVRPRSSEEKLIEKYFEVKNEKNAAPANNCYEILDSDEEAEKKAKNLAAQTKSKQQQHHQQQKQNKDYLQQAGHYGSGGGSTDLMQKSLLKPMSQRMTSQREQRSNANHIDAKKYLQATENNSSGQLKGFASNAPNYKQISEGRNAATAEDSNVSKNVKMSRMNLRQALKKAQHETMAAKAAANAPVPVALTSAIAVSTAEAVPVAKKYDKKFARPSRSYNAASNLPAMTTVKPIEVHSSSDDSTPERSISTPQATSSFPSETVDIRVKPDEYGQEMFLRLFGLFTPEMHVQMQQRRSKRKRRNVQSNERSDYHYGRFEYGNHTQPDDKKKRKDFLLSPQVKQRLQSKRPKRRSVEKSDETTTSTSRSGSSSPDEKRGCNECLKGGGSLDKCEGCKSFYHAACHRENDSVGGNRSEKAKLCPACKRVQQRNIKNETKQHENLQTTAKELEEKMTAEKSRRTSLQQESEMYKIQMNKLYNIVKAIKSDQENSSD